MSSIIDREKQEPHPRKTRRGCSRRGSRQSGVKPQWENRGHTLVGKQGPHPWKNRGHTPGKRLVFTCTRLSCFASQVPQPHKLNPLPTCICATVVVETLFCRSGLIAFLSHKKGLTADFTPSFCGCKEQAGADYFVREGKTGATPLENYSHAQQGEARSPGTSPASVCHIFEYVTSPVVHYGIVGRRRVRAIARNIVFCRDHRPRDAKPAFRDALS